MLVTISKLSDLTGMSRTTISPLLDKQLQFEPGPHGGKLYESADALRILYQPGALDPIQEKAQLDRARRIAIETEQRKKDGELIPADQVAEAWTGYVLNTKSRLRGIPSRVSSALVGLSDMRAIERTLLGAIDEALSELSGQK